MTESADFTCPKTRELCAAVSTRHLFRPQAQVAHVFNAEFMGLYGLEDLPSYHQPTAQAIEFTHRLIERMVWKEDVSVVIGDAFVEMQIQSDDWIKL